jgi:hypothetical protein
MSRFTPYRNLYGDNLTNADLIDTTDNLALIIKVRDLANFFPGVMDVGAFRRVDNIVNGAVVTGLIPQRPNYRFHNHVLFENVQATSAGRFLIRLSDSLFLAPQSDLEKNQNAVRKGLARNAQIRGVFGSPP